MHSAANGEAALQDWEEWNPGLILMDVHMPIMDGLEATRRIKADPRGQKTVVVTLTASALDDDRRVALQGGADDFLAKPCREDQLLEKMSALLNVAYDYEETNGAEGQPVGSPAAFRSPSATGTQRRRSLSGVTTRERFTHTSPSGCSS